jgi:ankyrin repeat protein
METAGGYTLLMLRVEEGNIQEITNQLKNPTTKINAQNKSGQSALALAVRNGNINVGSLLINTGADVNLKNKVHYSVIFLYRVGPDPLVHSLLVRT